jgi:hypothetical protein
MDQLGRSLHIGKHDGEISLTALGHAGASVNLAR